MPVFYRQIRSMGTYLDIVVPDLEDPRGVELMSRMQHLLHDTESVISNYLEGSELDNLNRKAFDMAIPVSEDLLFFIEKGIAYFERTEAGFDFTLGAYTRLPDRSQQVEHSLQEYAGIPIEGRIRITEDKVRFLSKDVCIDSGGLGKGFAILKIEKLLNDLDIPSAFISFGGSSILGKGKHPHGAYWKLGIQHPWKQEESLGEIELCDSSVSISGNSSNNAAKYEAGHILDITKGAFYTGKDIVTVAGKDHLAVEAVSTAMLASGGDKDELYRENFPELELKRFRTN